MSAPEQPDLPTSPGRQPQGGETPDAPAHPGMAPPRGQELEAGVPSTLAEQPRTSAPEPPVDRTIREGAVYRTPDGEERLVWVVRNGVAEYFARRPGERWRGTVVERGLLSTEAFAHEVGLG